MRRVESFCRGAGAGLTGLVALGMLLLPGLAGAQYYQAIMEPSTYQPLPIAGGGPVTTLVTADFQGWGYTPPQKVITLPFAVGFYGNYYTEVLLIGEGLITFNIPTASVTTWRTRAIPSTSGVVHNFVAVWWDQSVCNNSPGGPVKTQVLGTAPSRTFVIEWNHCRRYASTGEFTAQAWLSEGADQVEVHYGPVTGPNLWVAGMGVENIDGSEGTWGPSITGANCTPSCTNTDYPTNKKIVYSSGPNISVSDIKGEIEGFAGIRFPVSYTLANNGSKPANDFTVQYWVSRTPKLDAGARSIGHSSQAWSLNPREQAEVSESPRLPIDLDEGQYYLIVEADPYHVVPINGRGTTVAAYGPFSIGIRAANLAAGWVEAPETIVPGQPFEVNWLAQNTGNLGTSRVPYRMVLTHSRLIVPESMFIGSGIIDRMDMEAMTLEVTEGIVPLGTVPGVYYVGIEVDPNRDIFEHERVDNISISNPVVVSDGGILIAMDELPDAQMHGYYGVRLVAYGGDGVHGWKVQRGSSLPPGLSLEVESAPNGTVATFLRGVPSGRGDHVFTLEVHSGPLMEPKTFALHVGRSEHSLSVITSNLAESAFGLEYSDWLAAIGGAPPYSWHLNRGNLPLGLLLRSDGLLSGTPQQDGTFSVTVQVTDSMGRLGSKDLVLKVSPPSSLTCVTREFPEMQLGQTVREVLIAAGGTKSSDDSYTWASQGTTRLVTGLGEMPDSFPGAPPGLRINGSLVQGTPTVAGTYLWTVSVHDAGNRSSANCPVLVRVAAGHGLAVVTKNLPLAIAGRSYEAVIEATGGDGELTWSELGDGRVLSDLGLEFDVQGRLVGTPSPTLLDGESHKEFSFMARVQDERGRIGFGSLAIRLQAQGRSVGGETKAEEGGCQAGSGESGAFAALALLGIAALRPRRRRR